jgi:hypothetical protein
MVYGLILAGILLVSGWQPRDSAAQQAVDSKTPYIERSDQEFAFYPGGKIEIGAAAPGSFKIVGWQKAFVRVEMEKIFFYVSPDQAHVLAKMYPVHVTRTQTSAKITTSGPKNPVVNMEVNFQVYVPWERTDLKIKMIKGDLSVATLNGWTEATIVEGNVEAKDLAGYFYAVTKQGDLKVELFGKRWTGYSFSARTERGSVDLSLPVDYSANLQLHTKDGNISTDYPEQMVEGESVPLKVMAKDKTRTLSTEIGTGGSQIKLVTSSGDIVFKGISR